MFLRLGLRANVAGRIGNRVSQAEYESAFSACIGSGSIGLPTWAWLGQRATMCTGTGPAGSCERSWTNGAPGLYNWSERERASSCGLNGRAVTITIYTRNTHAHHASRQMYTTYM